MATFSSTAPTGGAPPLARGVPGNTASSRSVEAAAVSIAGGGTAPARGGVFVGGRGVWHITHMFPPLLGWVQASQAQLVLGKTVGMVNGWSGGGEVALRITRVQKKKKEKEKILPVDGADT